MIFVAVLLATAFQQPASTLKYDASLYWNGSAALVAGDDVYSFGALNLRGVLTPLVYAPSALVNRLLGDGHETALVLLQNAVLVGLVCAYLLPALLGVWRAVSIRSLVIVSFSAYLVLARFAPFSLMDIWAVALILTAALMMGKRHPSWLVAAGVALGVCVNLRPAYLLTAGAVIVACVVYRRTRGLLTLLGAVCALLPEVLLNWSRSGTFSIFPPDTAALGAGQIGASAFIVRYDTVAYAPAEAPSLLFCDTRMTHLATQGLPGSPGELAVLFLQHPLSSIPFVLEKWGAAMRWPVSAPYLAPAEGLNMLFGVAVTVMTVVGISAMLLAFGRSESRTVARVALVLIVLGALATITTAMPETRFALPLVLLGAVGLGIIVDAPSPREGMRARSLIIVVSLAVLLVAGSFGLKHPVPNNGLLDELYGCRALLTTR